MIEVTLEKRSLTSGEPLRVMLRGDLVENYSQVQVEIFDTGVMNPTSKVGFGTTPDSTKHGWIAAELSKVEIPFGVYEVKLVRLHAPKSEQIEKQVDLVSGRDFERLFFEFVANPGAERAPAQLLEEVTSSESQALERFASPIELDSDAGEAMSRFSALVFVRGVLIGTSMRFPGFEVVPAGFGVEPKDQLDAVNQFLNQSTSLTGRFEFDDETSQQLSRSNPVSVVHFPNIIARRKTSVRKHCISVANAVLLALSLTRDAGGIVFDVVVVAQESRQMTNYTVTEPYLGNLLVGGLAGESADRVSSYLDGMSSDPMGRFLAELYRQARLESHADYQYIRFWQILEILADLRNFDPGDDLLDQDGVILMDGEHPRKCKGSVNKVFALLRDEGFGGSDRTWERINIWFALRSAVAHHGAISRWAELSRASVREYARKGMEEIQKSGHDRHLWSLKEDAKLLIMRMLVKSASKRSANGT